jgi:hypothetical protein
MYRRFSLLNGVSIKKVGTEAAASCLFDGHNFPINNGSGIKGNGIAGV